MSSISASDSLSIPGDAVAPAEPAAAPDRAVPAEPTRPDVDASSAADRADPAGGEVAAERAPRPASELNPAECAAALKQRFPALFSGAPKPLKLRIQLDIQARAPGVFTKNALSAFFRRHTGSTSYLIAVSKAPHRFDLDGQPAGEISAEHRQVALDELARRRANVDARREAEDQQRQLEEQQSRNRATLLRDFERTTLTRANFCALKGVAVDALDGLLEIARREAAERASQRPAFDPRDSRPPQERQGQRPPDARGPRPPHDGRGARPAQEARGPRPPQDARGPRPSQDARGPRPSRPGPGSGPRPVQAPANLPPPPHDAAPADAGADEPVAPPLPQTP